MSYIKLDQNEAGIAYVREVSNIDLGDGFIEITGSPYVGQYYVNNKLVLPEEFSLIVKPLLDANAEVFVEPPPPVVEEAPAPQQELPEIPDVSSLPFRGMQIEYTADALAEWQRRKLALSSMLLLLNDPTNYNETEKTFTRNDVDVATGQLTGPKVTIAYEHENIAEYKVNLQDSINNINDIIAEISSKL